MKHPLRVALAGAVLCVAICLFAPTLALAQNQAVAAAALPGPPPPPAPPGPALDARAILSGGVVPLSIRLRDMAATGAWREFEVGAADQGLSALGAYMAVLSGGQNLGGQYFTNGQVLALGEGNDYLVAYRLPTKQIDFSTILGQHADFSVLPDVVTPDTSVSLSLLNLRIIGAVDNIRPFDMSTLLRALNQQRARLSAVLGQRTDMEAQSNLRELAVAVIQEAQDHNGTIPAIQTPFALKRAIMPDIHDDAKFLDPMTKRPFFANPFLAGHKITEYADPAAIVLLYADAPGQDGMRAVAFLDGGARMVDRSEWNKLIATQHLP